MKVTINYLIFFSSLLISFSGFGQNIIFKDAAMKYKLVNNDVIDADLDGEYESDADLDDDGEISFSEAEKIVAIEIKYSSIIDPSDLSNFENLKFLVLKSSWGFDSIDLLANSELEIVEISTNQQNINLQDHPNLRQYTLWLGPDVNSINIKNNKNLENLKLLKRSDIPTIDTIDISNNNLDSLKLNFKPNTNNYKYFDASNNSLTVIDSRDYSGYDYLNLSNNRLHENSFPDVLPIGIISNFSNNNFTHLNISSKIKIEDLIIHGNPLIFFDLDLSKTTNIKGLNFTEFKSLRSINIDVPGHIDSIFGHQLTALENVLITVSYSDRISLIDCQSLSNLQLHSSALFHLENINSDALKEASIRAYDSLVIIKNSIIGEMEFGNKFYIRNLILENNSEMTSLDFAPPNNTGANEIKLCVLNNVNLTELNANKHIKSFELTAHFNPNLEIIDIAVSTIITLKHEGIDKLRELRLIGSNNVLLLENLPELKNIVLSAYSSNDFSIKNLPKLDSLSLLGHRVKGITLNNLPNLTFFSFEKHNVSYNCNEDKSDLILKNFPKLENIKIENLCLKNLELSNLPLIKELTLRGIIAETQSLVINDLPGLEKLNINNIVFNDIQINNVISLKHFFGNRINGNVNFNINNAPYLESFESYLCSINKITFSNLPNLKILKLENNRWIQQFNASNLPSITSISINDSYLEIQKYKTKILLQDLPLLQQFSLTGRSLTDTLDLSSCISLDSLSLDIWGPLKFLNLANGNNKLDHFDNSGDLKIICTDSQEEVNLLITQLPTNPNIEYTQDCHTGSTNTYIEGGLYIIDDSGNEYLPNSLYLPLSVTKDEEEVIIFTKGNGKYCHTISKLGNEVTINTKIDEEFFESLNSEKVYPLTAHKAYFNQDSDLKELEPFTDLQALVNIIESPRPGEEIMYILEVKNRGSKPAGGTLTFQFDSEVMQVIESGSLSSILPGQLIGEVTTVNPYSSYKTNITFLLNKPTDEHPLIGGEELKFKFEIVSNESELTLKNNQIELKQTVVNSYDPNNILCAQGGTVDNYNAIETINYTINFENLGTDYAKDIRIENIIDSVKLNINSFELEDFSHNVNCSITQNKITFNFDDIYLPEVGNNKGFVSYSIQPRTTLNPGDSIKNQADIFFDYNAAITTDEHHLILSKTISTDSKEKEEFYIYPNPNFGSFTINGLNRKINNISLFDLNGRFMKYLPSKSTNITIDVPRGIYILRLEYKDHTVKTEKIIIL